MEKIISDEAFSALDFRIVAADTLTGFSVAHAEPATGPDGVALMLGNYPAIGQQMYIFSIFYDDADGLVFQRATVPEGVI